MFNPFKVWSLSDISCQESIFTYAKVCKILQNKEFFNKEFHINVEKHRNVS